jgi:hypothetical protein
VVTARQRDSLQAARWPAERHVMPSRPAVTVHTGSSPTVATAIPVLVRVRDVLGRDLGHDGPPVVPRLRLGCDGLHRGHRRCPATAHSSTVTNCLGQLQLGGGCAETHLRGRRVGPAGRSAMRTAAGATTVLPWTACCHSISAFSSCVCAMVSVPARYVAPPAGEPSPRPAPCRKARGVQRVLGVGGARSGEQPRTSGAAVTEHGGRILPRVDLMNSVQAANVSFKGKKARPTAVSKRRD